LSDLPIVFPGAAMTIQFRCQTCNKLLKTSDHRAGARGKCIHCGSTTIVPRVVRETIEEHNRNADNRNAARRFNVSVAAMVSGIGALALVPACVLGPSIGCALLAIVLGAVGSYRGRDRGDGARSMAVIGIMLGIVALGMNLLVIWRLIQALGDLPRA
jgi:phage FluMu protein Com